MMKVPFTNNHCSGISERKKKTVMVLKLVCVCGTHFCRLIFVLVFKLVVVRSPFF